MVVDDKEKCPCCSGKIFKNCCKPYIGSSHEDFEGALEKYEYIRAYNIEIARLTNYLINITAHTIPLLHDKNPFGTILFEIDLKAVEELLENIFYVLRKRKIEDNLDERLWTISKLVQCEEWENLFQLYTLLYCNLLEKANVDQYIDEITVSSNTDKKLLQVIFSNLGYKCGIGKKLEVANLIIQQSDSKFEQMQYRFAIAIEYYIVNDLDSSKKYADKVLEELSNYNVDIFSVYELNKTAEMYEFYAGLFGVEEYYVKAVELYMKCEETGELNNIGLSSLYNSMAYIFFKQQIFEKSIEYFNKSYEFEVNNFSLIHLAENYLYMDMPEKAEEYLKNVDISNLGKDIIDYYMVKAELAILINKGDGTQQLINEMRNLDLRRIPFYNDIFNMLISEIQKNRSLGRTFLEKMKGLHKYLILQPNFYGIGININKILDDIDNENTDIKN